MQVHTALLCDGHPHSGIGGSWIGHFLPGMVLLVWGLHWLLAGIFCHYRHSSGHCCQHAPFAATHAPAFLRLPHWLPLEAWLKVLLPLVAIFLEFQLSGTRRLRCPPGTAKAGQLAIEHMNSWAHATSYPLVALSGIADLVQVVQAIRSIGHGLAVLGLFFFSALKCRRGAAVKDASLINCWHHCCCHQEHHYHSNRHRGSDSASGSARARNIAPLPWPLPHVLLCAAFAVSAFLMLAHAKAEALDALLHRLLGNTLAAVAAAVLADGIWGQGGGYDSCSAGRGSCGSGSPGCLVLKMAKAGALMMAGAWFSAITHIMFANDITWAVVGFHAGAGGGTDHTRVAFTPVLFAWIFIGLLVFMLSTLLVMRWLLAGEAGDKDGAKGSSRSSNRRGINGSSSGYTQLKSQQWDWQSARQSSDTVAGGHVDGGLTV